MLIGIIQFLLKLASTEVAKVAIGIAVNKLIDSTNDGITKDVAKVMIDGIAKSTANPTTDDVFKAAVEALDIDEVKNNAKV